MLRLLGLHGYHGSAQTLRGQAAALADAIAPVAELVCVDAPSLADGDFGWWHATEDGAGVRYRGWERTRDWLAAFCARSGPFDGVLGFSQGAALAALVVALCAFDAAAAPRFDFSISIGGFASRDPRHAAAFDVPGGIAMPSLHIIGRRDGIVAPRASHALASRFLAPRIAEHDGGHVIPADARVHAATLEFLHGMARRQATRARPAGPVYPRAMSPSASSSPIAVPLWPGRAQPEMRVTLPDAALPRPRPALVIFRGGGYARPDGSGAGSAAWAASHGLVAIEVDYGTRSTRSFYPGPVADGARAIRLVRARAAEWGIDPTKVGVLGFSAGGHLASLVATQPDLYHSPDDDLAATVSARPDLVVLAYPLVSFVDQYQPGAFYSSVENFFGRASTQAEREQFSSELHVAAGQPPVFLWTTADDDVVPASHSERFAAACRKAGVPIVFTEYPRGPHGLGLALDHPGDIGTWTKSLLTWLGQQWGGAAVR